MSRGGGRCHIDLPGLVEAGVGHLVTAICVEPYPDRIDEIWEKGVSNFNHALPRTGDIRLHFALEGCLPVYLGRKLPVKPLVASLTWNGDNPYGSGIGGLGGLTPLGISLARGLHEQGTALDASHLNDRSRRDLLSIGFPVCATHCNSRTLCKTPRNLPDDDLREIANNGGVTGVTLVPDFLRAVGEEAAVEDVVMHIQHMAELAGVDSVGLGTDFDGVDRLPSGINGVRDINRIFDALSAIGWSDEDVLKVASGNWIRFFSL